MDSRTVKTLVAVGFLIGAMTVGAMGAILASQNTGPASDSVTLSSPSGMNATIAGSTNVNYEEFDNYGSDTVYFFTTAGNVSFTAQGPAWATIDASNITGTWTNVTAIDADANPITIDPEDKNKIQVGKSITHVAWRDSISLDDGTVDFTYGGSSGVSRVTLYEVPANTQIKAISQTGTVLDGATSDSNGHVTFANLDNSDHTVTLQSDSGGPSLDNSSMSPTGTVRTETPKLSIDVSDPDFPNENVTLEWYVDGSKANTTYATSGGTYSAEVGPLSDGSHDWYVVATDSNGNSDTSDTKTFTVDHYDPVISDIQPRGDLQSNPTQISAQINDTDFAIDGDSITVEIYLDGSVVSTQTINSNSTVTTSMPNSGQTGGEHNVTVVATDSYGDTGSGTELYYVPNTFFVRNETNHTQLVAANGSIRFFTSEQVYERNTSDGKFNMTGLPADESFIVEINPTDSNYTQRAVYVQNIYTTQSAYVLNTSAYSTIESRFTLNDPTGQYDSESVLLIKRPIEINGSTVYQTIVGDRFGVEGVTSTLQQGVRYQLYVTDGTLSQKVGPYRADVSETVAVQPGTPTIELNATQFTFAKSAALRNDTLEFRYSDPQVETTQLTIWIHERGNTSNQLAPNSTYGNVGNVSGIYSLTKNETKKAWVVNFVVDRNGETFVVQSIVVNQKELGPPVDSNWTVMIGIGMLVLFAGTFSVLNASIGAVLVALIGGLMWWLGFLPGVTSAMAVAVALFITVLGHIMTGGR